MESEEPRRRATRAARFPLYDLEDSIEVARRLHTQLGGQATAPELAARLGYSGVQNGAFINRMASARAFGLLEGGGNSITMTQRGRELVMPEDEEMELRARSETFEAIPLFAQFYEHY